MSNSFVLVVVVRRTCRNDKLRFKSRIKEKEDNDVEEDMCFTIHFSRSGFSNEGETAMARHARSIGAALV